MKNQTMVVEFIIVGLSNYHHVNTILFVVLLVVFLLTVIGNITVVTLSLVDHRLQSPMYFFLRNFSLLEICFTSVVMPRFLYSLLTERKSIPLPGCFLQLLLFFLLGTCVFFQMAMMSFDRYMAICHPLHYGTIMNGRVCFHLVLGCWVMSFLLIFPPTFMVVLLPFCGPNVINHFYCDTAALLQLSCIDTGHIEVMLLVAAVVVLPGTLTVTIISYGCIICTIMRIPSTTGRKKAFSTCSAHLTVVVILYSSAIFRYIRPGQRGTHDFDKVVSFVYCVVTQLFNPYIYALRNEQVKQALKDIFGRTISKCRRIA
ncbi:olfactory receptor 6C4-like [Trachemys scripta elegans]|uniref:olfactory receptor 6C4-like n=1 Tax=Trachemys scripta elegans TaxID=31138 RepID=UPI001551CA4F|nr:olfactory receptor 6C4-like [Trachemys scripta elegans]